MTLLSLKNSSKLFYKFNLNRSNQFDHEFYAAANHVSQTWADIEYLHYTFHFLFSKLGNELSNDDFNILFESTLVVAKDFYIHLDIIRVLFRDKLLTGVDPALLQVHTRYAHIWNKIRDARNLTIIHKEKPNFYEERGSITSTDPEAILIMEGSYIDKDGRDQELALEPVKDITEIHNFLNQFQECFNNLYPKDY